jgi:hypothetical protein
MAKQINGSSSRAVFELFEVAIEKPEVEIEYEPDTLAPYVVVEVFAVDITE